MLIRDFQLDKGPSQKCQSEAWRPETPFIPISSPDSYFADADQGRGGTPLLKIGTNQVLIKKKSADQGLRACKCVVLSFFEPSLKSVVVCLGKRHDLPRGKAYNFLCEKKYSSFF